MTQKFANNGRQDSTERSNPRRLVECGEFSPLWIYPERRVTFRRGGVDRDVPTQIEALTPAFWNTTQRPGRLQSGDFITRGPEPGGLPDALRNPIRVLQYSFALFVLLIVSLPFGGCKTVTPQQFPPVDLSDSDWSVKQGQAIWRPDRDSDELVAEFIHAEHPERGVFLQVIKETLPLTIVRLVEGGWIIESPLENKTFRGKGAPPSRAGWAQLANVLRGNDPAAGWEWRRTSTNRGLLENEEAGQRMDVYLEP